MKSTLKFKLNNTFKKCRANQNKKNNSAKAKLNQPRNCTKFYTKVIEKTSAKTNYLQTQKSKKRKQKMNQPKQFKREINYFFKVKVIHTGR